MGKMYNFVARLAFTFGEGFLSQISDSGVSLYSSSMVD